MKNRHCVLLLKFIFKENMILRRGQALVRGEVNRELKKEGTVMTGEVKQGVEE